MRRSSSELRCESSQIEPVALLERGLAYAVLLAVMLPAQADGPAVGGLETLSAIGALSHMSALDGSGRAVRHAATVAADPGPVSRAGAGSGSAAGLLEAALKDTRHGCCPP